MASWQAEGGGLVALGALLLLPGFLAALVAAAPFLLRLVAHIV